MITTADYERAESYLPWHVRKRMYATAAQPRWTGEGDRFWYVVSTRAGKRFVLVDPESGCAAEAGAFGVLR